MGISTQRGRNAPASRHRYRPPPRPTSPSPAAGRAPARAGAWRRQLALNGWRLLLTVVLLAAWEVAATTVTTPFWISQPTRVFDRLLSLATSGLLFWHVWATLQAALLGLALGGIVGVALGLLLGAYPRVAAVVDPLLMGLNSLPRVALAPLFIIWFGIGLPSKVILAFSLVVFPVLINAYQGVRGVDQTLVDMLRTMQASPWQVARRVTIPSTLPWIFAGLRIGLGMSPDRRGRRRARRLESRRRLLRRVGRRQLRHDRRLRRTGDLDGPDDRAERADEAGRGAAVPLEVTMKTTRRVMLGQLLALPLLPALTTLAACTPAGQSGSQPSAPACPASAPGGRTPRSRPPRRAAASRPWRSRPSTPTSATSRSTRRSSAATCASAGWRWSSVSSRAAATPARRSSAARPTC